MVARSTGTAGLSRRSRLGFFLGDAPDDFRPVRADDGRLQGQQFVERRAQRVNVGAAVDQGPLAGRLLGAHVTQRPRQVARHRQPRVALHVGHAEVGDPQVAAPIQQQVGRLDVAVHDPLVVGIARAPRLSGYPVGQRSCETFSRESTGAPSG